MTFTDWLIDILLVAVVLRQVREHRFSWHTLLLPIGGVAYAASQYLHAIPTAGNDLVLIGLLIAVGAALGVGGGVTTAVRRAADGTVRTRATATSAVLWVAGMGARFGFMVWVSYGGGHTLARFSAAHQITSADAWSAALILMVVAEVVTRFGIIVARVLRANQGPAAPAAGGRRVLVGAR